MIHERSQVLSLNYLVLVTTLLIAYLCINNQTQYAIWNPTKFWNIECSSKTIGNSHPASCYLFPVSSTQTFEQEKEESRHNTNMTINKQLNASQHSCDERIMHVLLLNMQTVTGSCFNLLSVSPKETSLSPKDNIYTQTHAHKELLTK